MKLGIETLFQLLLLLAAVFCLIGVVSMNQYILDGRQTLHQSIQNIECSNNREAALQQCVEEAKAKGYQLTGQIIDEAHPERFLLTLQYEVTYQGASIYEGAVQGYVI